MPIPKTWESTYNGKRLHFDKELNVLCEIDTGWTANIDTWERTMYPPIIAMDSRTVSGVTFTWDNGDAAATDNMISAYTTYWGWIDSGGTEHYIDNSTATTQTKIRECSAEYIEPGTPIILWARQTPYEGQYYAGEHLLPSLFSSCTFTTLSRLMTVTTITITNLSPSSFNVVWNTVPNAIGYQVFLYLGDGDEGDTPISSTTTNGSALTYTNLSADTTYSIRIIANADGIEYADSLISHAEHTHLDPLIPLDPPRNIQLVDRTESTLTFTWEPPESVVGLTGYTVSIRGVGDYVVDANTNTITLTNLREGVEYVVWFKSNGDKLDYDDSVEVSATGTPMRQTLIVSSAKFPSSETIYWDPDTGYTYGIQPQLNLSTPASVYTSVISGWSYDTVDWDSKTALTPAQITLTNKTLNTITISLSTPETDWQGNHVVGINEGRTYLNPTTTTQNKSVTTKTFTGLNPETDYTISVLQQITNSDKYFAWDSPSLYTLSTMGQARQVTNLRMISSTVTSVTFAWEVGLFGVGYNVHYKKQRNFVPTTATTKQELDYNTTQITITGLSGSTGDTLAVYYIGVVTRGDGVNFVDSDIVTASGTTQALLKLSGYTVTETHTARTIKINWTTPTYGGTPAGYYIWIDGGLLDYVSNTTHTYTVTGCDPSRTYRYGIIAEGDNVYNTRSDVVSGTVTTSALTPLATPTVTCTNRGANNLTFGWGAISHASGYLVETGTTSSNWQRVGTITDTSIVLNGLQPENTYYIRVQAVAASDSEYESSQFGEANGTTLSLVKLQPPRNITLIGMTPTTLKYSYNHPADTSGLTGYTFYKNNVVYSNKASGATREIEFTNLTPNTQYTLGFRSMGDQSYASDSDIVNVYGTPLPEELVISSNKFPSSETSYWDPTTGYTYAIQPSLNLSTPANVFTTVFTGWTFETTSWQSKTALTPVSITLVSWDYTSAVTNFSTAESSSLWNGNYLIEVASGRTFTQSNVVTSFTKTNATTSCNITNLLEGQEYTIRIYQNLTSSDNYFVMNDGSYYTFRTKQHVLPVSNISAVTVDVTSLTFTWDSSLYASGYEVYFKSGTTVNISSTPTSTTDTMITYNNLSGGTNYTIGVLAKGDGVNFGDATSVTTFTQQTSPLVPVIITSAWTTDVTQTAFRLHWTIPNNTVTSGFDIYYSRTTKPSTPNFSLNSTFRDVNISGFVAGRTYNIWVVGKGDNIYTCNSNDYTLSVTMKSLYPLPAPTLSSPSQTTTSVSLSWDEVREPGTNNYAIKYIIYVNTTGNVPTDSGNDVGRVTSHTFYDLSADTTYYFWIKAIGDGDYTSDSSLSSRLTQRTMKPPQLVVTFTDSATTTNSVTVNWNVNYSQVSKFEVYSGTTSNASTLVNGNVGGSVSAYTFNSLSPNTQYYFGVKAIGNGTDTTTSEKAVIGVKTKAQTQIVLSSIRQNASTKTSITFEWTSNVSSNDITYYVYSGTTQIKTVSGTQNECTINNLASGGTYNYTISARTSVADYINSQNYSVNGLKTNYVKSTTTTLTGFSATYTQIPASGTGTNYVTPSNVSVKSTTAYTVADFSGSVVSSDYYENSQTLTNGLTFVGTKQNTGLDLNTSNGGVKVSSRLGDVGSVQDVYVVSVKYNNVTSDNSVTVRQEANSIDSYSGYSNPYNGQWSATTVPARGGLSTPKLYNASSSSDYVRQTRQPIYTSTYTGDPVEFRLYSSDITTGKTDADFNIPSKGVTPSDVTTTIGHVWYAANSKTANTTVEILQSANTITGYTTMTISPTTTQNVDPSGGNIDTTVTCSAKYSSTDSRPLESNEYDVLWSTKYNDGKRNYNTSWNGDTLTAQFGTMGSNVSSNSGTTTIRVQVKDRTSVYKNINYRELKNIQTGQTLDVTYSRFGNNMEWNDTSVSQDISTIRYTAYYSSTASATSTLTIGSVTWKVTNTSEFSIIVDAGNNRTIVQTSQNTSTTNDKTTQIVAQYSGATFTSNVITQKKKVKQTQAVESLACVTSDSSWGVTVKQRNNSWEVTFDKLIFNIYFGELKSSGAHYYVQVKIEANNGTDPDWITLTNNQLTVPTTRNWTEQIQGTYPLNASQNAFVRGSTRMRLQLVEVNTEVDFSGATLAAWTSNVVTVD